MDDKPKWEMDSPYGEVRDDRGMKATKKHGRRSIGIGIGTISLILVLVLLVSTIGNIGDSVNTSNLFSSGDEKMDRPSLETIYTASPFYAPDIEYSSDIGKDHVKNMENKVKEIIDITDEMMFAYMGMKDEINEGLNIIVPLLQDIDVTYGENYVNDSEVLQDIDELMVSYELQEFKYYGMDISRTGEALYDSDVEFTRVVSAMTAAEKVTEAYELLLNFSSAVFAEYEGDDNDRIQQGLRDLEGKYVDTKAYEYGATLMAGVDTVNEMINQIDTANALLALDNLAIMGDNLELVKEDVTKLREANLLDEEFVELSELMVIEYENMYGALKNDLEIYVASLNLDMEYAADKSIVDMFKPRVVYATDNRYAYGAGYNVQMLQKKGQEIMKSERDAYNEKYKNESYWGTTVRTAKEIRKGAQEVVENLDVAVYQGARMTAGVFTPSVGDGVKDAYDDIKKRNDLGKKRIKEGKGGEEVFKTAVKNFEATQQMAADGWYNIGAFWEDELGLPEDSISQVGSQMGNIAAETFTQFGQGLSRILDPNAKDSDIAKGCIEITTSMVGGSQNIFSATKASGVVVKKMGEIIASPKLHAKGVIDALKAVKEFSLSKLGSANYTKNAVKGTMAILKKSKDVAKNMVDKLDDAFTKDITGIFTKNWKESLAGFRDYANKVGGNVDDSAVKLIDEFVNGYIDNKVTELASQPWIWDENISDEEKEERLAKEVDKINENIGKGIETIQGQLEDSLLNGTYKGTWTLLGIDYVGDEPLWERPGVGIGNLYNAYKNAVGDSYPCKVAVNGNILTFEMSPQNPELYTGDELALIYNTDDSANNYQQPLIKNLEIKQDKGEILGFVIETNDEVYITSEATKEITTIEGQYYFRFRFTQDFSDGSFTNNAEGAYGVTFGFKVERNN